MGLLTGSVSFVRYAVEGALPKDFWGVVAERIRAFSFRDIDDNYEERSIGWVSVVNMFDSDFAYASYAAGDYVALTLRIDERKVSATVLKKFCLKEEERIKKTEQRPRLSRTERMEIKERMRLMLLKRAVPTPAVYDMCWNLSEATLLFFSNNEKARTFFEQFFKETFGLSLALQIPYSTAFHLLAEASDTEALERISPSIFI